LINSPDDRTPELHPSNEFVVGHREERVK